MATKTKPTLDLIFRALSDHTRLRILNLLRPGELCVCDLVNVLDVLQPTASRHLAYLRRAGLVAARKEGLWHFYRLVDAPSAFHRKLLDCLSEAAAFDAALAADSKQLRSACRSNCCD